MTSDELRKAAYEVEATGFPLVGLNYRQSADEIDRLNALAAESSKILANLMTIAVLLPDHPAIDRAREFLKRTEAQ